MVVLLCAAGAYAAFQLPIAIFPKTDFPRVVIIIDDGVVPADQVLVSITRPIEEAMNGVPGIQHIRSRTERGASEIDLFFDWNTKMIEALQLVQGRLAQLTAGLPPTAQITSVTRMTFAVFPVVGYSLTSDKHDPATLHDLAQYTIKPNLARLPGVAQVTVAGGKTREFHVTLDPNRLASRTVTSQQVVDAVRNANVLDSPGLIEENHHLELALVSGRALDPVELNNIVVATVNNTPVLLSDVATVAPGVEPQYIVVSADGHDATLLNILRQPDANTVGVVDEVKAELDRLAGQLPPDVKVKPFYDQSLLVRDSIGSVRDAIALGLILSAAILFGFLRNVGSMAVAILVIPVTVLATFLAMWLVGLSFDLMTLGGIAAAIGLVIDDAIVVVENIYAHLASGESRIEAVQAAMSEITVPIIGSTITPVVVFLPLTLLTGVTGVFFRSLALTMAVALLTSLALALGFTPILAERFVKVKLRDRKGEGAPPEGQTVPEAQVSERQVSESGVSKDEASTHSSRGGRPKPAAEAGENGRLLSRIIDSYEWVLNHALDHKAIVMAIAAVVMIVSYLMYRGLGQDFLPEFDEGAFVLDYVAPPGTSLAETDRILKHVESMIQNTKEVESYSRRTGIELGLSVTEPNTGDFMVKLKANRDRGTDEVTADLRKQIAEAEPALTVEFAGILGDLIGDLISAPEQVEIKLFSENADDLHRKADEVHDAVEPLRGIVDTFNRDIVSGPAVTFKIDPERAAQLGANATDVAETVETAMLGTPASTILQKDRLIIVRVNMPASVRGSLDDLKRLPIRSATGGLFRLDQVADIQYDPGQREIRRDGLRQYVAITARLSGIDTGTAIAEIQRQLAKTVKLPPGMTVEYGGLYAEQQQSFRELVLCLGLAIVLVFIVLLIEFRSFSHPAAILAGAVLALGGVMAGLLVTGMTLNVVSMMGMIMVVGIVAKNGILMLDAVEEHLAEGDSLRQALISSGRRRFRPVLMTSLAAILGMAPLALALGAGAEMLQPLAIGVIGGLATALLLSLVLTPTVYAMLERDGHKSAAQRA